MSSPAPFTLVPQAFPQHADTHCPHCLQGLVDGRPRVDDLPPVAFNCPGCGKGMRARSQTVTTYFTGALAHPLKEAA